MKLESLLVSEITGKKNVSFPILTCRESVGAMRYCVLIIKINIMDKRTPVADDFGYLCLCSSFFSLLKVYSYFKVARSNIQKLKC